MPLEAIVRSRRVQVPAAPQKQPEATDSVPKINRGQFTQKTWGSIVHCIHQVLKKHRMQFFSSYDDQGYYPTLDLRFQENQKGVPVLQQLFRNKEKQDGFWRDIPTVSFDAEMYVHAPVEESHSQGEYQSANTGEKTTA